MMRMLFTLVLVSVLSVFSILNVTAESYRTSDEIPLLFEGVMNTTFSRSPDGTWRAKNAEKLQNRPADGYLKRGSHGCTSGQVAVGIDAHGHLQCGMRATLSLEIRLIEGSAQILGRSAELNRWVTIASTGAVLKTSRTERAVWQFRDESVIRMDTDTAIRVQPKVHHGNTIAHAVLQRGILWGRVIGHEMHAENNGIIAGVRGTSFMMQHGQNDIAIYHSRNTQHPIDLWIREAGSNRFVQVDGLAGKLTADAKLEYLQSSKTIKKTQFFGMNAVEYPVRIDAGKMSAQLLPSSPSMANPNALDIHRVRSHAREDIVYMNRLIQQGNSRFAAALAEELAVTNMYVCEAGRVPWKEAPSPDRVCLDGQVRALINVAANNTKMYYQRNGVMVKWPDNALDREIRAKNPYAGKFKLDGEMKGMLGGTKVHIGSWSSITGSGVLFDNRDEASTDSRYRLSTWWNLLKWWWNEVRAWTMSSTRSMQEGDMWSLLLVANQGIINNHVTMTGTIEFRK